MKKCFFGLVTIAATVCFAFATLAADTGSRFVGDHPDSYIVKKGDTLWDISGQFLNQPWYWPEIWHVNKQIVNPHLIFPGDIIKLVYIDGKKRLTLSPGTDRLTPTVHATPITGGHQYYSTE